MENSVTTLSRVYLDDSPLIIQIGGNISQPYFTRPFRFEACWLLYESFESFVNHSWDNSVAFSDNLRNFKSILIEWNKNIFGNVYKRKKILSSSFSWHSKI